MGLKVPWPSGRVGSTPTSGTNKFNRLRQLAPTSAGYAGRLHEALGATFGPDEILMDEFSIRAGEHWAWTIQQAVAHARVLVALIGPKWLTIEDGLPVRRCPRTRTVAKSRTYSSDGGVPTL